MQWKKIEEFPNYSISDDGKVRNDRTGRLLKFYKKPSGYLQVEMGHRTSPKYVHRLVAQAFIENKNNLPQVNHIDGNKGNNTVENLEWVTAKENSLAYGYLSRIENKRKKIIAENTITKEQILFNSRDETTQYFKCNKSELQYNKVYKKGNKKGWIFRLVKDIV